MSSDAALRQQAERHADRQEWAQATACFEALRARHPGDADVLLQLSYIASLAGRHRDAHAHALAAAQAAPTRPDEVAQLVSRLRTFNEVPALRACLARLGPPARMPVPLLLAFAGQHSHLNLHEEALALLDEARRREPGHPSVLVARGQALVYLGRFAEAEAELRACVARAPQVSRAWWLLAGLKTQTPEANDLAAIHAQLTRPQVPREAAIELAFALHKVLDDLGRHDEAWQALMLACRAKRALLDYRPEDSVALVDALMALPIPDAAASVRPADGPVPIFIVGMHRSGTTLLEQLLHGHPQVQGLGELYDFTVAMREATDHPCRGPIDLTLVQRAAAGVDFAAVGRHYLDGLAWRLGPEACFTDKLPSNFLNIGFIAQALPQARILHLRRDAMEVGFSNLRELFHEAAPYSYDLQELGGFHRQYERLMAHWQRVLPGRILDVDYAALVRQPEAVMREVTAFCGLDFVPAMLDIASSRRGVSTASAVSVRQGIVARTTPKWAPYAAQLQPLADALGRRDPV